MNDFMKIFLLSMILFGCIMATVQLEKIENQLIILNQK